MKQPEWITQNLERDDIEAINYGGCASGAYMPAVTYYHARETMNEHGDEVLDYIVENIGELPRLPRGVSWAGIAVHYLSYAVELWCLGVDLDALDNDDDDEED